MYQFKAGEGMDKVYPDLIATGKGKRIESPPWNKKTSLKTLSNIGLQVFAKTSEFHKGNQLFLGSSLK